VQRANHQAKGDDVKPTTPTEPFFTEMDFNPAFDGHLSSVKAAQLANAKIQPLVASLLEVTTENARLQKWLHLERGHHTKAEVDLKKYIAENTRLRAALEEIANINNYSNAEWSALFVAEKALIGKEDAP